MRTGCLLLQLETYRTCMDIYKSSISNLPTLFLHSLLGIIEQLIGDACVCVCACMNVYVLHACNMHLHTGVCR